MGPDHKRCQQEKPGGLPQLWYHQQVQLATPTVVSSTGTAGYPNCGFINRYNWLPLGVINRYSCLPQLWCHQQVQLTTPTAVSSTGTAAYPNCGVINRYSWLPQLRCHQQKQLPTPTVVSSTGTADYPNCGVINRNSWLPQLWYHQQVQLTTPTVVSSTGTADYPNCSIINRYSWLQLSFGDKYNFKKNSSNDLISPIKRVGITLENILNVYKLISTFYTRAEWLWSFFLAALFKGEMDIKFCLLQRIHLLVLKSGPKAAWKYLPQFLFSFVPCLFSFVLCVGSGSPVSAPS